MTDFVTWWAKRHRIGAPTPYQGRWEYEVGLRVGAFSIQFYWLRKRRYRVD